MLLNRNTNRAASAVALKNSSKSALIGNVLSKEAYYFVNGSLVSKGGYTDSEFLRVEQGKSFLSPQELTTVLQANTPNGLPYPPLPPTPPQGPFPSKAFFSPNARQSTNLTYVFNTPSSTNIFPASSYTLDFSYSYPIYASSYGVSITSNISNFTPTTDYQTIYVNIPNISFESSNYTINLYGSNNYGSSKVSFSNPYTSPSLATPPVEIQSTSITSSNTLSEVLYTFPPVPGAKYYLFQTYNSNGTEYPSALYYSQFNAGTIRLRVYGLYPGETYTTRITASNSFGTSQITLTNTTFPLQYDGRDILEYARYLNRSLTGTILPKNVSSNLTIHGENQYNFDFVKYKGNVDFNTVPFASNTFFTGVADTTSAWVIVDGNLTIDPFTTFTPPVRKLFTVLYVTGELDNSGIISMSARGANHSNLEPHAIYIGDSNRTNSLSNIFIPAVGGSGGAGFTVTNTDSNLVTNASNGANGATGGGSTGALVIQNGTFTMGSGAAGTAYSGGAGSGGIYSGSILNRTGSTSNAASNGGAGTYGVSLSFGLSAGGGAGNPSGSNSFGDSGISGTGGTLIVIVEGMVRSSGIFAATGTNGMDANAPGGGSGGGSITVLYGALATSLNSTVVGGSTLPPNRAGNGSFNSYAIGGN